METQCYAMKEEEIPKNGYNVVKQGVDKVYADDDKYQQVQFRELRDWYILARHQGNCQAPKRLTLPMSSFFRGKAYDGAVLYGYLNSQHAGVPDIFVGLGNLKSYCFDGSKEYRGFWVETETPHSCSPAVYRLMAPHHEGTAQIEDMTMESRLLLGLLSNIVDLCYNPFERGWESAHKGVGQIHKDLTMEIGQEPFDLMVLAKYKREALLHLKGLHHPALLMVNCNFLKSLACISTKRKKRGLWTRVFKLQAALKAERRSHQEPWGVSLTAVPLSLPQGVMAPAIYHTGSPYHEISFEQASDDDEDYLPEVPTFQEVDEQSVDACGSFSSSSFGSANNAPTFRQHRSNRDTGNISIDCSSTVRPLIQDSYPDDVCCYNPQQMRRILESYKWFLEPTVPLKGLMWMDVVNSKYKKSGIDKVKHLDHLKKMFLTKHDEEALLAIELLANEVSYLDEIVGDKHMTKDLSCFLRKWFNSSVQVIRSREKEKKSSDNTWAFFILDTLVRLIVSHCEVITSRADLRRIENELGIQWKDVIETFFCLCDAMLEVSSSTMANLKKADQLLAAIHFARIVNVSSEKHPDRAQKQRATEGTLSCIINRIQVQHAEDEKKEDE